MASTQAVTMLVLQCRAATMPATSSISFIVTPVPDKLCLRINNYVNILCHKVNRQGIYSSCSSYSYDEESDIEGTDEAQEILPYQFEPEYTEEEILQLEAAGQGHGGGVEDRQQNTDW